MAQSFNSSDRKAIRAAEKAAALRSIQDAEAITAIMSTIPGRAWMWRKLGEAHIFVNNFSGDPIRDAFSAGERNAGLILLADIMLHCPDQYLQMTKEANNERHDSNNRSPDADSLAERRSGSFPDRGDSRPYSGSAEGSELDDEPRRFAQDSGDETRYHN
jgi:hypothetical protein